MTNTQAFTSLSVRGEAQRTTAPDEARVFSTVSATADSKGEATSQVQEALAGVLASLDRLGGRLLTPESARAALTWSAQSMRTQQEFAHDKVIGERQQSSVTLLVTIRDLALLEGVLATMTSRGAVEVHSVSWSVDEDNSEWALVRADAIRAALLKGKDYAAALGGVITTADPVADAGLLGGDGGGWVTQSRAVAFGTSRSGGDDISLDPVPQILSATIEARFTAAVSALPDR